MKPEKQGKHDVHIHTANTTVTSKRILIHHYCDVEGSIDRSSFAGKVPQQRARSAV